MTSPDRIDDELLERYLDGDLAPEDESRVRALVEASPELEERLARHARLGDAVRASDPELEARLGPVSDSDALFARIEGALGDRAPTASSVTTAAPSNVVPLRRSRVIAVATVGLLAAAAAALFFVPGSGPRGRGTEGGAQTPSFADARRGSEILDIDFGNNTGTTFSIEGTEGEALAVVWISDSEL